MSTESWVISAPQTIDIAEVSDVSIVLTDGSIDVVGETGRTTATLEVLEISDRPLELTNLDGHIRAGYDFNGVEGLVDRVRVLRDKERVVARLLVPVAVAVKVSTAQAAVNVTGMHAKASVNTATGPVRVAGHTGKASIRTASGTISVSEHIGDLKLSTASGEVTAMGNLSRVNAVTVSGTVRITSEAGTPHITANSVSGDVYVHLALGTPVNLRVRAVTGKVSLDGEPQESSTSHATCVDHADSPGVASAYLSANTVTANVAVTRG